MKTVILKPAVVVTLYDLYNFIYNDRSLGTFTAIGKLAKNWGTPQNKVVLTEYFLSSHQTFDPFSLLRKL